MLHFAEQTGGVPAAQFRDATGISRKRAVQILEFFDRVGFTQFVEATHRLREDSCWGLRARLPHAAPHEGDW